MRRLSLGLLLIVGLLVIPMTAGATPPPDPRQGHSPEPASALLLLAGAVPTYAVYRRVRSRDLERGRPARP